MRLLERKLRTIQIAARQVHADGTEGFSEERTKVRARIVPVAGGLESRKSGLLNAQTVCLLLPADCAISAGDGVCTEDEQVNWRCIAVQHWPYHTMANLERIAGR